MKASNQLAKERFGGIIKISAQVYAVPFYNRLGYHITGEEYLEDGIPHIAMVNEN